jgi:uncharacterized membrane protein YheB (UPF0754 family)
LFRQRFCSCHLSDCVQNEQFTMQDIRSIIKNSQFTFRVPSTLNVKYSCKLRNTIHNTVHPSSMVATNTKTFQTTLRWLSFQWQTFVVVNSDEDARNAIVMCIIFVNKFNRRQLKSRWWCKQKNEMFLKNII